MINLFHFSKRNIFSDDVCFLFVFARHLFNYFLKNKVIRFREVENTCEIFFFSPNKR